MRRVVATLPEGMEELCLVRLGFRVRKLRAWPFALRVGRAIDRAAAEAIAAGAGLLSSETFLVGRDHLGVIQYWRDFESLDAWSRRPPHSEWWGQALERMRTKGDFGISHETYLVPRAGVEAIAIDCPPTGLFAFGATGEATGPMTTSRGRLGRR